MFSELLSWPDHRARGAAWQGDNLKSWSELLAVESF